MLATVLLSEGLDEADVEDEDSHEAEYTLAFETNSESSSIELDEGATTANHSVNELPNGHIVMVTNTTPLSCNSGGEEMLIRTDHLAPPARGGTEQCRKEQINSSTVKDGVVVTKAIVTIG